MTVVNLEIMRLEIGEISISSHDDGEYLLTLTKPRLSATMHLTSDEFSGLKELLKGF